jgi:uncharacterized membrane protein
MGIFIIFIIGMLWCFVGIVMSSIAKDKISFVGFMSFSGSVSTLLSWIVVPDYGVIINKGIPDLSYMPLVIFLGAMLATIGFRIMNYAMRIGHHGATWTIGQSALVIPFLFSIFYYSESPRVVNLIGLFLAIVSMILLSKKSSDGRSKTEFKSSSYSLWVITAFGAFIFIGAQQVLYLVPFNWSDWSDTVHLAAPISLTGSALTYITLNIISDKSWAWRLYWKKGIALSVITVLSQTLLMVAINMLSSENRSGIVFPFAIGICTISFSLYSLFVLKEKSNKFGLLGMVLGALAVVCIAL